MSRILVGQKILFNLIGPYFETVFKNPPGALFKILRTIASCFFEIHPGVDASGTRFASL